MDLDYIALAYMAPAELSSGQYGCVTCVGCTAAGRPMCATEMCRELRATGICQRQVYARLTLTRLFLDALPIFYENKVETKKILETFREMIEIIA